MMVRPLPANRCRLGDYFRKGNARLHAIGILGGVIWNVGMGFNLIAATRAGSALPMVWGRGPRWSAHSGASSSGRSSESASRNQSLLAAMFAFYLLGLGILIASKCE